LGNLGFWGKYGHPLAKYITLTKYQRDANFSMLLDVKVPKASAFSGYSRPTQPPTLSQMGTMYGPKCGDDFLLGNKAGIAHSICGCTCRWQVSCVVPH